MHPLIAFPLWLLTLFLNISFLVYTVIRISNEPPAGTPRTKAIPSGSMSSGYLSAISAYELPTTLFVVVMLSGVCGIVLGVEWFILDMRSMRKEVEEEVMEEMAEIRKFEVVDEKVKEKGNGEELA